MNQEKKSIDRLKSANEIKKNSLKDEKTEIKVGPVSREDSRRIWEIRNDPISRQNFNNTENIPFEKHEGWFEKKYFSGQDNFCFVAKDQRGKTIGYCRFDFDGEQGGYVVSLAVDSSYRGRGIGSQLLNESLRRFDEPKPILAEIQKNNLSSLKVFKKNNFVIYNEDDKNNFLKKD